MNAKDRIGRIIKTIVLPLALYLLFWIISKITGQVFFTSRMGTMTILRETIMTAILAYGAFYNLTSGRFDFSLGAVWLVAGIFSFNLAAQFQFSPWLMLLISMISGAALSALIAAVYILLKAPAIVVCLGMMLVYESISAVIFDGIGVSISQFQKVNVFGNTGVMVGIFVVVFVVMYIINNYTSFGYRTRALATGQKVAVKMGIREKSNVLLCWIISGVCAGIAVVFEIVSVGVLTPQTNFGSSTTMIEVLLPVFLGAFLGKYSENTTGILMATLSVQILKVGLNGLQIDPYLQSILNILCLLIFVVYSSTKDQSEINRLLKHRARRIAEERATM